MDEQPRFSVRGRALFPTLALMVGSTCSLWSHEVAPPHPVTDPSGTAALAGPADEASYLAANDAAMTKMMKGMALKPTGDVDRDFVALMVPHHQGAVEMALAYLRYGHNQQLERLAQEIIVTQQQEIAAMHLAVGERLPPARSSAPQAPP